MFVEIPNSLVKSQRFCSKPQYRNDSNYSRKKRGQIGGSNRSKCGAIFLVESRQVSGFDKMSRFYKFQIYQSHIFSLWQVLRNAQECRQVYPLLYFYKLLRFSSTLCTIWFFVPQFCAVTYLPIACRLRFCIIITIFTLKD